MLYLPTIFIESGVICTFGVFKKKKKESTHNYKGYIAALKTSINEWA